MPPMSVTSTLRRQKKSAAPAAVANSLASAQVATRWPCVITTSGTTTPASAATGA